VSSDNYFDVGMVNVVYYIYKGDGLGLIICACYSWEIELDFGLDLSFGNM
jgi:hypothetical protein